MPRSTREWLLRWYDQAQNDLRRCQVNLGRMFETYDPDYPEHAAVVLQLTEAVQEISEILRRFRYEKM